MREEFEKWFYDNTGLECEFDSHGSAFVTASPKTTGDTIANTSCNIAWGSWQASRAADKDAARYRWLRNSSNSHKFSGPLVFMTESHRAISEDEIGCCVVLCESQLDEMVDKAIYDSNN
ncbi:MAG: hypothetical protein RR390_00495 [Hafnia sp.]